MRCHRCRRFARSNIIMTLAFSLELYVRPRASAAAPREPDSGHIHPPSVPVRLSAMEVAGELMLKQLSELEHKLIAESALPLATFQRVSLTPCIVPGALVGRMKNHVADKRSQLAAAKREAEASTVALAQRTAAVQAARLNREVKAEALAARISLQATLSDELRTLQAGMFLPAGTDSAPQRSLTIIWQPKRPGNRVRPSKPTSTWMR